MKFLRRYTRSALIRLSVDIFLLLLALLYKNGFFLLALGYFLFDGIDALREYLTLKR